MLENNEKIELINQAIDLINEAKNIVDDVIADGDSSNLEANYNAYGCYGFNTLLGSGNPYDSSLITVIEAFSKCDNCSEDKEVIDDILCNSCRDEIHREEQEGQ